MEKRLVYDLKEIENAAQWFINQMGDRKIFAFQGQMGAGKTTFIKEICKVLGIKDTVSSPTFSLVNQYLLPGGGMIYHMDLYRIKNEEEAFEAGIEDLIYSGNICFVEWPEKAGNLFSSNLMHVNIEINNDQSRCIKLQEVP
ncbi:MAG: tRNA (adenosine(37)-N6)-threonylcarbamoyltransferase complex ATPase subunit type 1 TsaE [Chitinophagaceae bacterium]